jgi:hypothetical protein
VRAICLGLACFVLWAVITQPGQQFRYETPTHATINTQNGGTP